MASDQQTRWLGKKNMLAAEVGTEPADDLAPHGARPSAGTVLTNLCLVYIDTENLELP